MAASNTERTYIFGLGNPGEKYRNTYHNIGFLFLDHFLDHGHNKIPESPSKQRLTDRIMQFVTMDRSEGAKWKQPSRKQFEYNETEAHICIKPLTFMNRSGLAVVEAMRYFDGSLSEISIVHDDFDITIGNFKTTERSGAAGHNGVTSIIDHLGTNAFHRTRIGIRPRVASEQCKAEKAVLKRIPIETMHELETVFDSVTSIYRPR
jgi:PTH1 family peptidyl-tRNA hydrolase